MNTNKSKKSYYKRIKLLKFIMGFCCGFLFSSLLDTTNSAFEFGYLICANICTLGYTINQFKIFGRDKNDKKITKKS